MFCYTSNTKIYIYVCICSINRQGVKMQHIPYFVCFVLLLLQNHSLGNLTKKIRSL